MKSIKTAGLLTAIVAVLALTACRPARSAESTILYVRNQVYTAPTWRSNGDIYASLTGLLKALRFGWKVEGNAVIISDNGRPGASLGAGPYSFVYRNKPMSLPTQIENGDTWVSARSLAQAIGAGYQVNATLHMAEIYFVAAAAPAAPAKPAEPATPAAVATPAQAAAAPPAVAAPAGPPSGAPAPPKGAASGAPAPPAVTGSAAPAAGSSAAPAEAAPPSPSPTPQPDVDISRKSVVPDWTNGRLDVTIEVENPADVPAKDVTVQCQVVSGEGDVIGTQTLFFGVLAPHQKAPQSFSVTHPDGTSMPRSLYDANCTVTFNR